MDENDYCRYPLTINAWAQWEHGPPFYLIISTETAE